MYLGIDFGTSFSQMATIYLEQPLLLLNPGDYGIPSEFYFDNECGILIGQDALDCGQGDAAENLVSEVKMAIFERKKYVLDGRPFETEEIVYEIYKTLFSRARLIAERRSIFTEIEGVVISIPVKFGIKERHLISKAARKCISKGINIKIIKEPVAAALAYDYSNLEDNKYILVYDLGGGTCDIALLKTDSSNSEHYTVVDSDGLRVGGRDWDKELIKYITEIVENQSGVTIRGNIGYEEKIRRTANFVKHQLSNPANTRAVARVEINGRVFPVPVTKNVFDEITCHLLNQTVECLQDVYDRNVHSCDINQIICVGGSSNMLQVKEKLEETFPNCSIIVRDPEHAVVNGTAIYANMRRGRIDDISNYSYGIESYDKDIDKVVVSNVIIKGNRMPATGEKRYCPGNSLAAIVFNVYESEIVDEQYLFDEDEKYFVGSARFELPKGATSDLSVSCQFKLTSNGMLEVEAHEPSGKRMAASFEIDDL